jgi:hypothetical protein
VEPDDRLRASPANNFTQPTPLPFDLTVDMITLGEAARAPSTRAILERIVPGYVGFADVDYVSRMSLRQTANWGVISQEDLERIDAELAELPESEWPVEPVR